MTDKIGVPRVVGDFGGPEVTYVTVDESELTRLRAERDAARRLVEDYDQQLMAKDAEVERLRIAEQRRTEELQTAMAEVERRQKALDDCVSNLADARVEAERLQETLREIRACARSGDGEKVRRLADYALGNDREC